MITVYIPAIGQQEYLDQALSLMIQNSDRDDTKFVVIDNGSKEPLKSYFDQVEIIRNEENVGMLASLQQARDHCTSEILIMTHSDMMIYEKGWDDMIAFAFHLDPKLGLLGLAGARVATPDGGRAETYTSFRSWEAHGKKTPYASIIPCALLDGCFMAFRKLAMIDTNIPTRTDVNGYLFLYDKGQSLRMTMASWHVGVIGIESEHFGGLTSCREEFNDTLRKKNTHLDEMYRESEALYINEWRECFPVRVSDDWTVHVGRK